MPFSSSAVTPSVIRQFVAISHSGLATRVSLLINQPLPYAPSSAEAMSDYGRIHLHLDSYPVSGTTTNSTLSNGYSCAYESYSLCWRDFCSDSQHAGFADHICSEPLNCPAMLAGSRSVTVLLEPGKTARIRQSPIFDDQMMPLMFVDQLQQMLCHGLNV